MIVVSAEIALRKNSAEMRRAWFLFKSFFALFCFMVRTSYGVIPDPELMRPTFPSCPEVELSGHETAFNCPPSKLTPKLAYFVGYFCGDGGLKDIRKTYTKTKRFEHKLIIADEFEVQIKIIQGLFKNLFGSKPPIRYERIEKGEHTYYLNPTSKAIYSFLVDVFELPPGSKYGKLKIPKIIACSNNNLKRWFIRGVFDADGDTRAVEKGFTSQSRVKLRMKSTEFIKEMKLLLEGAFGVSVNGPYLDKIGSSYIQVERFDDLKKLNRCRLFLHPIKRWRLGKSCSNLISSYKAQHLKQFT